MTDANDLNSVEQRIETEYRKAKEALAVLRRYLSGNGSHNGHIPAIEIDDKDRLGVAELADLFDAAEDDAPQTIIDTVEQIMQTDTHKKWSVPTMVSYLKSANFNLQAKKPEATMGLVFQKLCRKRKTIVRVRRGSGRTPALYRGLPREHQEDASNSDIGQNERAAS